MSLEEGRAAPFRTDNQGRRWTKKEPPEDVRESDLWRTDNQRDRGKRAPTSLPPMMAKYA